MTASPAVLRLRRGRERPLQRGETRLFAGAVHAPPPGLAPGDPVRVLDTEGNWVAAGLWEGGPDLAARLVSGPANRDFDADLLRDLVFSAVRARHALFGAPADWTETTGWRMVFSDADGLSGIIADQFGDTLAVQLSSPAWIPWWDALSAALREATSAARLCLRPAPPPHPPLDLSALAADPAPDELWFRENGFLFRADPADGQKTGFYLDQRDNRRRVAALARGRRVLSAYCYTGAFEVCAAAADAASVMGWDASADAVALARLHHERNHSPCPVAYEVADVPARFRLARDRRESWDLIILDPPRLAPSPAALPRALRAYKDVNLLALKCLAPGGLLATFSCSGALDDATFRRTVGWAVRDSRRRVRVLDAFTQPPDHPRLPESPVADYLKGLLLLAD